MRRPTTLIIRTAIGGVCVWGAVFAASDARPGRVVTADTGQSQHRSAADLPRGIRSWGDGAVRPAESPGPSAGFGGSVERGVSAAERISGATMAGGVRAFALSADGSTAVYIADQDTLGRFELYSTALDGGSTPTRISTGLPFDSGDNGVSAFQITPDGSQVIFLADPDSGAGADDIFSVPIDGSSAVVKLSAVSQRPITAFGLTADSASAVFFGIDSVAGTTELFAATVGSVSSARQISDVGAGNLAGAVVFATISPDSAWVVYAADAQTTGQFQWHSVATSAAGPGSDVVLSAALQSVSLHLISPDSTRVAYTADPDVSGVYEVFEVGIAGGTSIRLSPAMAGTGARALEFNVDGSRLAYLADQDTPAVVEVYTAEVGVADSGTRLSDPMSGTQSADTLSFGPDGVTLLYAADQNSPDTFELFSATIGSASGSSTLYAVTPPDSVGRFGELGTPIIGRRAVFPLIGTVIDLLSVPFDGSEATRQVNDTLLGGETVRSAYLPSVATTLLMFGTAPDAGAAIDKLWVAPIGRDLPQQQINATATSGSIGVTDYAIDPGEAYAVYAQDQQTSGKVELYSRPLDSDDDGVNNTDDNCPFEINALQDPVVLGQTLLATDTDTFAWGQPTDVRYVRGPLDQLNVYATNDAGTVGDAVSFTDLQAPASGSGFYYLFAPDCAGRSYQNELGGEPDRDLAAFP